MAHGAQSTGRFGSAGHLAGRFLGALAPHGPADADEHWALAQLLPGERELWQRMSGPDRRHGVAVARAALAALERDGQAPERAVAAAALLHDVGKVESDLGTLSRVAVTIAAVALGDRRLRGRAGLYVAHDASAESCCEPPAATRSRSPGPSSTTSTRSAGRSIGAPRWRCTPPTAAEPRRRSVERSHPRRHRLVGAVAVVDDEAIAMIARPPST